MNNTINVEIIEKFMLENNISKTKFCKMCKISLNTLNKIMANNFNFEIIALFRIARIIKIEVYQMFNQGVFTWRREGDCALAFCKAIYKNSNFVLCKILRSATKNMRSNAYFLNALVQIPLTIFRSKKKEHQVGVHISWRRSGDCILIFNYSH